MGPSRDGAAASISIPESSDVAPFAADNDPQLSVVNGQPVEPGRVEARHAQGRNGKRTVRTPRQGQHRLLEANVGEPDLPARKLDELELEPRRAEGELRPVRTGRADLTFA